MPTHEQNYRTHAHPKPMGVGANECGRGRGRPLPVHAVYEHYEPKLMYSYVVKSSEPLCLQLEA